MMRKKVNFPTILLSFMAVENNKKCWHWLQLVSLLLVAGMIFYLSSQTATSLSLPAFPGIDKVCHFIAYAALAISFLIALPFKLLVEKKFKAVLFTALFCFLYALTDEFHQSFVPGRYPDLYDIGADMLGVGVTTAIFLATHSRLTKILPG